MNSKQDIQKTSYALSQLEIVIQNFTRLNNSPPCICISGLRHLSLTRLVKNGDFKNIIRTLFQLLKIPVEWVLDIKNSTHNKIDDGKIPFDAYIYLIDNHVKVRVYKLLLNHLKHAKQTKIHIQIVN
jgi:hypothetical protein